MAAVVFQKNSLPRGVALRVRIVKGRYWQISENYGRTSLIAADSVDQICATK
jgi:hypothetical protein